jgi:antitoxin (DNA-binding transcriptional repressor) of toxin-antitoxin stability system
LTASERIGILPKAWITLGDLAKVAFSSYFVAMRAVGIKILKNKLSEYVRLAAAGETVLISDRDRIVAQLGPPERGRGSEVADALLADAVRQGLVAPAALPPGEPPAPPGVMSLEQLLAELDQAREDR